eukprot:TRINITY_DN6829_c0_g1_i6.p1 TRINITY_DN6829_c0_g1~~TRINITY_DN6829_c0_g1_i6.p1  ORF type:complete len:118 (-),score=20.92 TRINITY_DN6829_c0_g1_i6:453-806(-)
MEVYFKGIVVVQVLIVILWNFSEGNNIQVDPQAWMDDLIIISDPSQVNRAIELVHHFFKEYNMQINWEKTKALTINTDFIPVAKLTDRTIQIPIIQDYESIRILGFYINKHQIRYYM